MRETIKFRAWHNGGSYPEDAQMLFVGDNVGTTHPLDCYKYLMEGQPVVLMQYTGLTDKNGKEIYCGDIIRCKDDIHPAVVKFDDLALCWSALTYFKGKENELMTLCRYIRTRERSMRAGVEVIGNIHENPELLEAS